MMLCCGCIAKHLRLKTFKNGYKWEDIAAILFQNPTIRIRFICEFNWIVESHNNSRAGIITQDLIARKEITYIQGMCYWAFPSKVEKVRDLPLYWPVLCFIWKPQNGVTIFLVLTKLLLDIGNLSKKKWRPVKLLLGNTISHVWH